MSYSTIATAILTTLAGTQDQTFNELGATTPLNQYSETPIRKALTRLTRSGIITFRQAGNSRRYSLSHCKR